jgi:hypothetical protein
MAYTREKVAACPAPCDPGVLSILVNNVNGASPTDSIIKIPWNNCKLVYGYSIVTTTITASKGDLAIDLERTLAGGTGIATVTSSKGDAVGTVHELTITASPESNLIFDDGGLINIEVTGASSAGGQAMLYLFFEPATY